MKCTECENWSTETRLCKEGDSDVSLSPDEDIFCDVMDSYIIKLSEEKDK